MITKNVDNFSRYKFYLKIHNEVQCDESLKNDGQKKTDNIADFFQQYFETNPCDILLHQVA